MNNLFLRRSTLGIMIGLSTALSAGCVATVGGYGYDGGGVGVDYYEPYGAVYGGWGPGYQVGPFHNGGYDGGRHGAGSHAYRSAGAGHSMPSIPSRSRGSR